MGKNFERGGNMLKSGFKLGPLAYVITASVLLIVSITTISLAKFSSNISGYVYNDVATALIEFDDGGSEVLELEDWSPGDSQTTTFSVKNFNGNNEVNQVALNYQIVIKTAAILDLTFTLSKMVSGSPVAVALTKTIDSDSSFSIYKSTTSVLAHTSPQTDQYSLEIEWDINANNEAAINAGGDYIRISVDWQQKTT